MKNDRGPKQFKRFAQFMEITNEHNLLIHGQYVEINTL